MKLKGTLLATAAILMCGLTASANASERLSVYEVNTFVAQMTNAVNNPNPIIGTSFLKENIAKNAMFKETNAYAWNGYYGHVAYDAWNNYYRYPYGYGYVQPTSVKSESKSDFINALEHKKTLIPRYHQSISILGTRMPADAKSATLDVNIREFGYNYALTPYGGLYNGAKIQHANSRCNLTLTKENSQVKISGMNCNRAVNNPAL